MKFVCEVSFLVLRVLVFDVLVKFSCNFYHIHSVVIPPFNLSIDITMGPWRTCTLHVQYVQLQVGIIAIQYILQLQENLICSLFC